MIIWLDLKTGELFRSELLDALFCGLESLDYWTGRNWSEFEIVEHSSMEKVK
jgi:hypothetical protein